MADVAENGLSSCLAGTTPFVPINSHPAFRLTAASLCGLVFSFCLFPGPRLAAQDELAGGFSSPAEIQKRLAAAQTEAEVLPADASPALREQYQLLETACQNHLAAVDIANKAKAERDAAAKDANAWSGFPQPPPYPVTLLDQTRETLAMLENSQHSGEAQLRIFTSDLESARNSLDAHQQAERRFQDATSSGAPEARQAAERALLMEQLSSRIATERIARLSLRLEAQQAELDMIRSKSQLAELQLKALEGKTTFTQTDLDGILERIASERKAALAAVEAANNSKLEPNPLLSWKIEFLDLEKTFWETRFSTITPKDSSIRKTALATLENLKKRVDDWIEIGKLRLEGGPAGAEKIDPAQLRDSLQRAGQMQRLIGFTIADLKGRQRGTPVWDHITSVLGSLWNMELYLAEETDITNGQKRFIYRAVTLGKLVRLAFILILGWLVLRVLSQRLHRLVSRKANIPESTAEVARKWSLGLGLALLLLYGMNTVHIPITAFAFLGGALAIGVGFGTQTLLKNFISGIILIFERPLKVGDVVEVEGITGRIRSIGIRASVITHFDGIDTLVPNSALLENQVTNWSFSDTVIRHFILVGVAYGSPTREVSRLLLGVAKEHGLVLDNPAPEVRFENFGDNSLVFRLLFWLDTGKAQRDPLASDLRFMIDKAFAEAGIVMSFPQRDLHFDPEKPLRVELSRSHQPNQPTS